MGLALILVLAACGSKKEGEGGGGGKSKSGKGEATGDVSTLFTGTTPTLPAEIAKATFDMPEADVLKATGADSTYLTSKTHKDVSYDFDFTKEEKKLEKVIVAAPIELEPTLTKLWGPPIKNNKGEAFWFDPATGTRAFLPDYAKGKRVAFTKYGSLETLFGTKGWDLAIAAGKPLIGATIDELNAAWGGKLCDYDREAANIKASFEEYRKEALGLWHDKKKALRLCLALPRGVEQYTPLGDTITFGRMGKVEEVAFTFQNGGSPVLAKQAIDFFDAKFGKPVEVANKQGGKQRFYFNPETKQRVIVILGEESVVAIYGRYISAAEWLKADAPGVIAVATPSMPGGTFEQIEKEDPEHFNPHGGLAELVFPASDWTRQETDIGLDIYDKAKNTYAYSVVLHHTDNEAAGDEVFKLLEAKFGPAKKDAKWTETDQYFNFKSKDGKKIETRRSSQQWWIRVNK